MFKAILLEKTEDGKTKASVQNVDEAQLPEGEVLIDVHYSTINYKDALAITGKGPVVRQWPMVPGIDIAGTVKSSTHAGIKAGDTVIVNGWGMGETRWGGLGQVARVKGDMVTALPKGLSARHAMSIGTAGYTAMLCVLALERNGITPESGPVLVTGANGGVGSFAISLLSKRGYQVTASTGRPETAEDLKKLGASEVIDRSTLSAAGKPLQKERWAAAVDCVGSHTLANVCASLRYGGVVAACGLAQGMDFPSSVAPFILRGVTLAGVDSVYAPAELRHKAWDTLAQTLDAATMDTIAAQTLTLEQAIGKAGELLDGKVQGRVVVDVNA